MVPVFISYVKEDCRRHANIYFVVFICSSVTEEALVISSTFLHFHEKWQSESAEVILDGVFSLKVDFGRLFVKKELVLCW